ncbi:MAG: hypothetical protein LVS60_05640 [Nodosilinea sp. LVE1205-7]
MVQKARGRVNDSGYSDRFTVAIPSHAPNQGREDTAHWDYTPSLAKTGQCRLPDVEPIQRSLITHS